MFRVRKLTIHGLHRASMSIGPLYLSVDDEKGYSGAWRTVFRVGLFGRGWSFSTKFRIVREKGYWVGECGPELFVPTTSGRIIAARKRDDT